MSFSRRTCRRFPRAPARRTCILLDLADSDRTARIVCAPSPTRPRCVRGGPRSGAHRHDPDAHGGRTEPRAARSAQQRKRVLDTAVAQLHDVYRLVFIVRDVKGLTTSQTGAALRSGEEAVKMRLHRARAMLRRAVSCQLGAAH